MFVPKETDLKVLGKRFREIRVNDYQMSLYSFSIFTGISISTLSKFENGKHMSPICMFIIMEHDGFIEELKNSSHEE